MITASSRYINELVYCDYNINNNNNDDDDDLVSLYPLAQHLDDGTFHLKPPHEHLPMCETQW